MGTHLGIMDYKAGGGIQELPTIKEATVPAPLLRSWMEKSGPMIPICPCLSAKDGKLIWKVNVLKEHAGINPRWKNACSPLIVDDLVIIYGGGAKESFLAFDKNSGKVKWKTGSELRHIHLS